MMILTFNINSYAVTLPKLMITSWKISPVLNIFKNVVQTLCGDGKTYELKTPAAQTKYQIANIIMIPIRAGINLFVFFID